MPCSTSLRVSPRRAIGLALIGLAVLTLSACKEKPESAPQTVSKAPPVAITFCHGSVTDILPRIALDQGYFADEGLDVTLKDMSDGKQAFDGLLQGGCDFAVNGAPPIVSRTDTEHAKFAIIATVMGDDDSTRIIARRDRGIIGPQDLKGKRIGVKKGIIGHFFLDLFMMKHGLEQSDVTQVYMDSDKFQSALSAGEIDGFSMTNKMVQAAARTLGDQAMVFAEPGLNIIYAILSTRIDIPRDVGAAPQVLKALVRAEEFAKHEPAAAKAMVAKAFKITDQEIDEIWGRTVIEVALANSLFVNLEDQYKWMVERGVLPSAPTFPNFLAVVEPSYLRAIKPHSVSLIKH